MQEKARLAMENARLQRENKNLQELLMYHMVRSPGSPGAQGRVYRTASCRSETEDERGTRRSRGDARPP